MGMIMIQVKFMKMMFFSVYVFEIKN